MAHLVFVNTQLNIEKTKEPFFLSLDFDVKKKDLNLSKNDKSYENHIWRVYPTFKN